MNKKGVRKKINSKNVSIKQTQLRIAPIPTPEELRKYEEINPGFAERIIKMAEQERIDRNKLEDKKIQIVENSDKRYFRNKNFSLVASLISIISFLGLAYFCINLGYVLYSLGVILVPLVAIIGYLTFQKRKTNNK